MKKLLFIIAMLCIFLISCNKNFYTKAKIGFNDVDSILANNMINHFNNSPLVSHVKGSSLRRINLTKDEMKWLTRESRTKYVNFFLAAYLPTDDNVADRNQYTVLFQLKKENSKDISKFIYEYYDASKPLNTARVKPICPPPPCGPTEQ